MSDYYFVRGAKMSCSKGSNERKINLPVSHGSYAKGKPILNKKDSKPENISYFGVCTGGACMDDEEITVIDKNGCTKTGKKCKPITLLDWVKTKDDTLIEGEPALTTESVIFCSHGGNIKFVTSGQEDE